MTRDAQNDPTLAGELAELRAELLRMQDRLAAMEAAQNVPAAESSGRGGAIVHLDEERIAMISAAVAAFLGVKPHIRQIRLAGGASWAQQGRVTIQASHSLSIRHD
jgi:methylmalonyl-CoA carboxyltransferase large subunit